MKQSLYELLRHCTARVSVSGKTGYGTGFFVAPGLLLTSAHVIRTTQFPTDEVQVFWDRQSYHAQITRVVDDVGIDLALLRVDFTSHPCVLLAKGVLPFDNLYSYGYPDIRPGGEPATFILEGKVGDQEEQLKFKNGQVRPGLSGSPLLNVRSGYVCGVIQHTRGRNSEELGGRAIPVSIVFQVFPEVEILQRQFHRIDQRWMDCLWEYPARTPQGKDRQRMMKRVHSSWIRGVLEPSLHGAMLIDLELREQQNTAVNPGKPVVRESDPLPPTTTITQLYDRSDGELLILGEPGCGKTTLLLDLARDLLDRARLNTTHPMPVVFNLSSWALKRQSITDWLIEELHQIYQVPRKLGKSWIEQDQVLPLFDGLDEITLAYRTSCVEAINRYRQEHNTVSLVICSRSADYLSQAARLRLFSSVVVQPPSEQQINEYLESAGPQLAKLRIARLKDVVLKELMTTPLMLSILTLTYHDIPFEDLLTTTTLEARRQRIFATYTQQMFKRGRKSKTGQPEQVIHWLSFLAGQLYKYNQTIFSVEEMQLDWLVGRRQDLYQWSVGLVIALCSGLAIGLPLAVLWIPYGSSAQVSGLVIGAVVGMILGIRFGEIKNIQPAEAVEWSWGGILGGLAIFLLIGLVSSLLIGLILKINMPDGALGGGLIYGGVIGLICGSIYVLYFGLSKKQLAQRENLSPNEGIRRSGKNGLLRGLFAGLIAGLPVGLFAMLITALAVPELRIHGQSIGQILKPPFALIFALLLPLLLGMIVGISIGAIFGVIFGVIFGLGAFVQHFVLRTWLWRTNSLPWNIVQFLNEATELLLLRKVGGNYIFIHRLQLEYFASLDSLPASQKTSEEMPKVPSTSK